MSTVECFENFGNVEDIEIPLVRPAGDDDIVEEVVTREGVARDGGSITPTRDGVTRDGGTIEIFKGMKFLTVEDAKKCYQEYAAKQGFTIRVRTTYKNESRSGEPTGVKYVCSCEGKYRSKPNVSNTMCIKRRTSHDRKECNATMVINKDDDSSYRVTTFTDEHSHELASPSKRILLSSQRGLPQAAKDLLHCFDAEGIQLNKVVPMFGETSNLGFDQRTCWNYIRKAREYNEGGDAQSVKDYFEKMMIKDPGSYHAIQQDEHGRAINFFWIDGRSRNAYNVFGDVVSFDTTYRTNKYKMPFAPFTGVNHNGQSILLGCALLENEVEETFVWVFEHWLRAMGGKAPKLFLTDQDRAMSLALARVMPKTCHRYCIWHIKKKFGEKIGSIYFKNPTLKDSLDHCIHKTYTVVEFESEWAVLIENFGLGENIWLSDMYKIREKWVDVYFRSKFFAGMRSTQRSESINHFFNRFVMPQTTLKEFVKNYGKAVARRYEDERKQDHFSRKERVTKSKHHLLGHAAKVYSIYMYNKFAHQLENVCQLRVDEFERCGDVVSFKVRKIINAKHDLVVKMNFTSMEGYCLCYLFESLGIPCKHLLAVFDRHYITEIPPYFILQRWRKDAARFLPAPTYLSHGASHNVSEAIVASDFCRRTSQLSFMAARSEKGRTLLNEIIENAFVRLQQIDDESLMEENDVVGNTIGDRVGDTMGDRVGDTIGDCVGDTIGDRVGDTIGDTMTETLQTTIDDILLDPHVSQTKGRTSASHQLDRILTKTRESKVVLRYHNKAKRSKFVDVRYATFRDTMRLLVQVRGKDVAAIMGKDVS